MTTNSYAYSYGLTVIALVSGFTVMADRDNNYYKSGSFNPNLNRYPLYHAGPGNVLESLEAGNFEALFLQYHGCV